MIDNISNTLQVSRHTAKWIIVGTVAMAIGFFGGAMYALGPVADTLREDRVSTHCLPIAADELGVSVATLTVTGEALSRCWITTTTNERWIVWYGGSIDDRYGLERTK